MADDVAGVPVSSTPDAQHVDVLGLSMAYRSAGSGRPIVLLHGNPTSSHLWRHIIPALAPLGRVVAPDLVGMGSSDRFTAPGATYRFEDHARHLDGFLRGLDLDDQVVLVGHDWGGALALDWASRHEDRVRGVAYTETMLRPRTWSEESAEGRDLFGRLRTDEGERLVLEDNVFVEQILAGATRDLSVEDLDVYRTPYRERGESRRPMLTWAREIPFDGEPADVHHRVAAYSTWLTRTAVPKLLISADPGAILTGSALRFALDLPAQRVVEVRAGHFVPEDAPQATAVALVEWIASLPDADQLTGKTGPRPDRR